jgi:spermidine synthase
VTDAVEHVEVARARSDRGEVVLSRRLADESPAGTPDVLELRVNGVFVMDNVETTSETALARAALDLVDAPASVLVGGLGLGFTAHEVLSDARVEHVVVAEIEEALVGWFRDGTVPHGPLFLADQRVSVTVADVRQVVEESAPDTFDLVLLDVDNGPDFLVHAGNAGIYESNFLERVRVALRPGGALAIWSSTESARLVDTMSGVFGDCSSEGHPVTLQGREDTFWLHVARKGPEKEDS